MVLLRKFIQKIQHNIKNNPYALWPIFLIYIAFWSALFSFSSSNFDGYGDMTENYAWGQVWNLGNFKHPPLLGWIVYSWFQIFPRTEWPYFLLCYLNSSLGLLGVGCLTRRALGPQKAWLAMLALSLSVPYLAVPSELNATTILLSLWPWTIYFFFISVCEKKTWASIGLGLFCALSMLGKYYSVVLLLSLLITTLLTGIGRQWYKTKHPYSALFIFSLCLAPHISWLITHGFPTLHYTSTHGTPSFFSLISIPATLAFYWFFSWGVILYCGFRGNYYTRFCDSILPRIWLQTDDTPKIRMALRIDDFWLLITFIPFILTPLLAYLLNLGSAKALWICPAGSTLPLLWLSRTTQALDPRRLKKARYFSYGILSVALLSIVLYNFYQAANKHDRYYLPYRALAHYIEHHDRHHPPQWIAGSWQIATAISFYSQLPIRALPGFPNQMPALITPQNHWEQQKGLLICWKKDELCQEQTENWQAHDRLSLKKEEVSVAAQGWRFPKYVPYQLVIYWYFPR